MVESAIDGTPSIDEQIHMYLKGQEDPEWYIREIVGGVPWDRQVEIMESVRDHRITAVRSCHSAGKDWVTGHVVIWFLGCHQPSKVVTTAPTDRQVRNILWSEIRTAHKNSRKPLGGKPLTQHWELDPNWFATGFTTSEYKPDKFHGFHSEYILIVVDEASGVSAEIMKAVVSLMSGGHARLLLIGNPTDPLSPFAGYFKRERVNKIVIPAWDTPNFKHFGIKEEHIANESWRELVGDQPLPAPYLITPEWVWDVYDDVGPDNPYYVSRVNAEFPTDSPDTLIPLSWVERAVAQDLHPSKDDPNRLGIDVARWGINETVIMHRHGPQLRVHQTTDQEDTMQTCGRVQMALTETGAQEANIDEVGIGAGVVDRGRELNLPFNGINFGSEPSDKARFFNLRAEAYWNLRTEFERGEIDLEDDEKLKRQLCSIKWHPNSKGQIVIEKKEDMVRRGLKSPDRADGSALASLSNLRRIYTEIQMGDAGMRASPWRNA